jgi:serine/threonine-protein kinase RsbW
VSIQTDAPRGADRVDITVPADPASLATVRLFSASVGATFGVSPDDIEDLKLVLSELCAGASGASDVFAVTVEATPGGLRVRCRGVAWGDGPNDDRRRGILEALIPDAEFSSDAVSFVLGR